MSMELTKLKKTTLKLFHKLILGKTMYNSRKPFL